MAGLLGADPARAGRPLAIDDADPAGPGDFEFEAGAGYVKEDDVKGLDVPLALTCGAAPDVEVSLGWGGQFEERAERLAATGTERRTREEGVGDLGLGAKWQFLPAGPLGTRHALAPSMKFPTAHKGLGSGETDYDLTWIVSRALGEKAGAHVNLGYTWIGGPDDDVLHGGVAVTYQVAESFQLAGEIFAERATSGGAKTVGQIHLGLRYDATDTLVWDLGAGSRIGDDGPDFTATAGLTWTFKLY